MLRRLLATLVLLSIATLTPGCARIIRDPFELPGHLVIVGGGLKDDNAPIHTRFVQLCAEGPIGIIPIASGDGLQAGEEAASVWRRYAGDRPVIVIPLTKDDAAKADDPAIATQIASCGGLWFTGGDQSRVTAVLKPEKRSTQTACLAACFKVLNRRGVIGGTSAGAAIMSDPMIIGGQSPGRTTRDADDPPSRVRTGPGLGFLPPGVITDQHFLERGRMGRLIELLNNSPIPAIGLGIRENCAVIVDVLGREAEALGDHAVCVLAPILTQADTDETMASLSVLSSGDKVSLDERKIRFHPADAFLMETTPLDPDALRPAPVLVETPLALQPRNAPDSIRRLVPDPWDCKLIEESLDRLAKLHGAFEFRSSRLVLRLSTSPLEPKTRVFVDPTGARPPCVIGLRVGFRPARAGDAIPPAK